MNISQMPSVVAASLPQFVFTLKMSSDDRTNKCDDSPRFSLDGSLRIKQ